MSFWWTTLQRGSDGSATLMANDNKQRNVEMLGPVFETCQLGVRSYVARDSHDKQIAQSLIENDLWGHAGIRTTQNLGVWMLA